MVVHHFLLPGNMRIRTHVQTSREIMYFTNYILRHYLSSNNCDRAKVNLIAQNTVGRATNRRCKWERALTFPVHPSTVIVALWKLAEGLRKRGVLIMRTQNTLISQVGNKKWSRLCIPVITAGILQLSRESLFERVPIRSIPKIN